MPLNDQNSASPSFGTKENCGHTIQQYAILPQRGPLVISDMKV